MFHIGESGARPRRPNVSRDDRLIDKFRDVIRSAQGETPRLYGIDAATMDYLERIVDHYLQVAEGEKDTQ